LYDALHPAVLRAIHQVVIAGHRQGKPVGVCGEMAGDPAAAIVLLGMGVDSLSMSVASLSRVKWAIRNIRRDEAETVLAEVLDMEDTEAVRDRLEQVLDDAGLGGLVRAGK